MSQSSNGFNPPTNEEIAVCAYLIWEKEGRQLGCELQNWLQAETQLQITRAHEGWLGEKEAGQNN